MRATLCLIPLLSGLLFGQSNRFDILITGAKVIDGSGNSWYYADVGIRGDTIAAVKRQQRQGTGVAMEHATAASPPRPSPARGEGRLRTTGTMTR